MQDATLTGADPALLRRLNLEAVLRAIRGRGPMTVTEIGRAASLSRQTVDAVLSELAADGWVEELAPGRAIGRPARRYRFRAEAGMVLGVDAGVHSMLLMLADLDGEPLGSRQIEHDARYTGAQRLEAIRMQAADYVSEHGRSRLRAVCLGVPGIVDAAGRVRRCAPLPEWDGLDLAADATGWFGCPASAENDANLAAVAEHWRGAARDAQDFIQLLIGHRAGAAIVLGGRLHRGRGGAAGEVSGLAILGWDGGDPAALSDSADAARTFADAAAGEPDAVERVERFALSYAQGTAAMVLTVNPELVVIGGGVSRAGETLAGPLRRQLQQLCLDPPQVRASELGTEAVALGAVRRALDYTDRELFAFA